MKNQTIQPDEQKTVVIFRKNRSGNFKGVITAWFPYEVNDNHSYNVVCYAHIGQHSSGDYQANVLTSKLATTEEYTDLKNELESIGYNLDIRKRQHYATFLKAYYKARK